MTPLRWRMGAIGFACLAGALAVAFSLPRFLGGLSGCETPYVEFDVPSAPRVRVEVARDTAEHARGLMERESLDQDAGMLFIFEQPRRGAFWMKDTLIPLSIAFIGKDGVVVDIQDMEPLSLQPHAPPGDYLYALETNTGWFASHNVSPGARMRLCLP